MAGLLGMDDDTLAILGGLLSKGMIGRGINSYLDNKQRTQALQLIEDEKRRKQMEHDQRIADAQLAADEAKKYQGQLDYARDPFSMWGATGPVPKFDPVEAAKRQMQVANVKDQETLQKIVAGLRSKFGAPQVGVKDGQPVFTQFSDAGEALVQPGVAPPPKTTYRDTGKSLEPTNDYDPNPRPLAKTTTPDADQSNRVAQGNLALSRERFNYEKGKDAAAAAAGGRPDKAPTEAQANAVMFGLRAKDTDKTLRTMEDVEKFDPTGVGMAKDIVTAGRLTTNWMASAAGQKYVNTGKNFVAAVLRKESGAQITESEWEQGTQLYIPMPGDSKEVLLQKRRNRELAIQGMDAAAGPHAKEPKAGASGGWAQPNAPQKVISFGQLPKG